MSRRRTPVKPIGAISELSNRQVREHIGVSLRAVESATGVAYATVRLFELAGPEKLRFEASRTRLLAEYARMRAELEALP